MLNFPITLTPRATIGSITILAMKPFISKIQFAAAPSAASNIIVGLKYHVLPVRLQHLMADKPVPPLNHPSNHDFSKVITRILGNVTPVVPSNIGPGGEGGGTGGELLLTATAVPIAVLAITHRACPKGTEMLHGRKYRRRKH